MSESSCSCCCLTGPPGDDDRAEQIRVTADDTRSNKATVVWRGEEKFQPVMKDFFDRVRAGFHGNKSDLKFEKWNQGQIPEKATTVVIVVPQITRLGTDVDHALDDIEAQPQSSEIGKVVLVLHNQAPHVNDVPPSDQQLTDAKYRKLSAILDLQIYEFKMRHSQLNNQTAKKLAEVLQRTERGYQSLTS